VPEPKDLPRNNLLLWEHIDFAGASLAFRDGTNIPDMRFVNCHCRCQDWNDRVSSLIAPTGSREVVFFADIHYPGDEFTITSGQSLPYVGDFWNDKISSIAFHP